MGFFKKTAERYTGFLRSWKLSYVINNLLHSRQLQHNKEAMQDLGLDRNIYRSIGTKDLPKTNELPWLDGPGGEDRLKADPRFLAFSSDIQEQLLNYVRYGFIHLEGFFSEKEVQEHNERMDQLFAKGEIYTNYGGTKLMNVHEHDTWISERFFKNQILMDLLHFVFGKKVLPFQTIHFFKGSQQKAHSDSIHMSTYPPGYLVGIWTALEDIGMDQGPLFYYPGSHTWPYVSCEDYVSGNTSWTIGQNSYARYEDYMEKMISEKKVEPVVFTPKAGDVLIWHANLIHGGMPRTQADASRRSMVGHYYADEVFCYHEISQRPALINQAPI